MDSFFCNTLSETSGSLNLFPPTTRFFLFVSLFLTIELAAQKTGINGSVLDQAGKPVSFATIGVEKTSLGTMANEEGKYRLDLLPGNYTVYFQCLGFQTVKKEVEVSNGAQEVNITLSEQVITTKAVTIASRVEDPAYSIMRKAIARAKVNKLMVDAYTAEVYIRGSGRIIDLPFLVRPLAKKNGIDENTVFFKETLEKIEFRQPNQYKERVIASRSTAGMLHVNQDFLKQDLYDPKMGEAPSPLSPAAFRYYTFQYLGAFTDRGHEIFKIKVTPRRKGQNIWDGEIYIIDQTWCIHSAHLAKSSNGFDMVLTHTYAPVDGIWMPVQVKHEAKGTVLQITVDAVYNASIRKYKITKNEKLYADFQKLEQQIDEKTTEVITKQPDESDLKKLDKLDKKMMKKLAKEYIKEKYFRRKKNKAPKEIVPPPSVQSSMEYTVDSNAERKDTAFWAENRLVPLTEMEEKSYIKLDSIQVVEDKKDSLENAKNGKGVDLSFLGILMGKNYYFGKKDSIGKRRPQVLRFFSPLGGLVYNAVEGYALDVEVWFKQALRQNQSRFRDDRNYIQFGPKARYSFARNKVIGSGIFQYGEPKWVVEVAGGTDIRQVNNEDPMSFSLNSTYALLDTRHMIRLYESDFVRARFLRRLSGRIEAEGGLEWENRIPLTNSRLKNWRGKELFFESNEVTMPYAASAVSGRSVLAKAFANVDWYPFLESSLYNESQSFNSSSSPRIRFQAQHAVPSVFNSTMDFTQASLSYRHSIQLTTSLQVELFFKGASMLRSKKFGQMDALHLFGNRTFLLNDRSVEQFRNLPYYYYSSSKFTLEGHLHLYRDDLILGWLFPQSKKWREMVFVNAMANPNQPTFVEYGYGIDKLFRILHLEVVRSQWEGGKGEWRFMVGGSFNFNITPRTYDKSVSQSVSL